MNQRLTLLALMLGIVSLSCSKKSGGGGGGEVPVEKVEEQNEDSEVAENSDESKLKKDAPYQTKNYQQIFETYERLTGVDGDKAQASNGDTIRRFFDDTIASSLPASNDAYTINTPLYVGAFKLAGEFCDDLYDLRNQKFQRDLLVVDLTKTPAEIFVQANMQRMFESFAQSFWGRELRKDEGDVLFAATGEIQSLVAQRGKQEADIKRGVIVSLCSLSLASVDTLKL